MNCSDEIAKEETHSLATTKAHSACKEIFEESLSETPVLIPQFHFTNKIFILIYLSHEILIQVLDTA